MKKLFKFGKGKKNTSQDNDSLDASGGDLGMNVSGYEVREKDLSKIHKAAWSGDLGKIKTLARKDPSPLDKENRTPLHLACAKGHGAIVAELLEWKAKVNLGDNHARTPLIKAVQCHQEDCVKLLLEHRADANAVDKLGNCSLHYATSDNLYDIVSILVSSGSKIDVKNKEGRTPLHIAAAERQQDMCQLLLEEGANVNAQDNNSRTPLMQACEDGDMGLVKLLLQFKADTSFKDMKGWTADDCAIMKGQHGCSQLIADYDMRTGRGPKQTGSNKSTPVHKGSSQAAGGFGAPAVDAGDDDWSDNTASKISGAGGAGQGNDSWGDTEEEDNLPLDKNKNKQKKPADLSDNDEVPQSSPPPTKKQVPKLNLSKLLKPSDDESDTARSTDRATKIPKPSADKSKAVKRNDSNSSVQRSDSNLSLKGKSRLPQPVKKADSTRSERSLVSEQSVQSNEPSTWSDNEAPSPEPIKKSSALTPAKVTSQKKSNLVEEEEEESDFDSEEESDAMAPGAASVTGTAKKVKPDQRKEAAETPPLSSTMKSTGSLPKDKQAKIMADLGMSDISEVSDPDISESSPRRRVDSWDDSPLDSTIEDQQPELKFSVVQEESDFDSTFDEEQDPLDGKSEVSYHARLATLPHSDSPLHASCCLAGSSSDSSCIDTTSVPSSAALDRAKSLVPRRHFLSEDCRDMNVALDTPSVDPSVQRSVNSSFIHYQYPKLNQTLERLAKTKFTQEPDSDMLAYLSTPEISLCETARDAASLSDHSERSRGASAKTSRTNVHEWSRHLLQPMDTSDCDLVTADCVAEVVAMSATGRLQRDPESEFPPISLRKGLSEDTGVNHAYLQSCVPDDTNCGLQQNSASGESRSPRTCSPHSFSSDSDNVIPRKRIRVRRKLPAIPPEALEIAKIRLGLTKLTSPDGTAVLRPVKRYKSETSAIESHEEWSRDLSEFSNSSCCDLSICADALSLCREERRLRVSVSSIDASRCRDALSPKSCHSCLDLPAQIHLTSHELNEIPGEILPNYEKGNSPYPQKVLNSVECEKIFSQHRSPGTDSPVDGCSTLHNHLATCVVEKRSIEYSRHLIQSESTPILCGGLSTKDEASPSDCDDDNALISESIGHVSEVYDCVYEKLGHSLLQSESADCVSRHLMADDQLSSSDESDNNLLQSESIEVPPEETEPSHKALSYGRQDQSLLQSESVEAFIEENLPDEYKHHVTDLLQSESTDVVSENHDRSLCSILQEREAKSAENTKALPSKNDKDDRTRYAEGYTVLNSFEEIKVACSLPQNMTEDVASSSCSYITASDGSDESSSLTKAAEDVESAMLSLIDGTSQYGLQPLSSCTASVALHEDLREDVQSSPDWLKSWTRPLHQISAVSEVCIERTPLSDASTSYFSACGSNNLKTSGKAEDFATNAISLSSKASTVETGENVERSVPSCEHPSGTPRIDVELDRQTSDREQCSESNSLSSYSLVTSMSACSSGDALLDSLSRSLTSVGVAPPKCTSGCSDSSSGSHAPAIRHKEEWAFSNKGYFSTSDESPACLVIASGGPSSEDTNRESSKEECFPKLPVTDSTEADGDHPKFLWRDFDIGEVVSAVTDAITPLLQASALQGNSDSGFCTTDGFATSSVLRSVISKVCSELKQNADPEIEVSSSKQMSEDVSKIVNIVMTVLNEITFHGNQIVCLDGGVNSVDTTASSSQELTSKISVLVKNRLSALSHSAEGSHLDNVQITQSWSNDSFPSPPKLSSGEFVTQTEKPSGVKRLLGLFEAKATECMQISPPLAIGNRSRYVGVFDTASDHILAPQNRPSWFPPPEKQSESAPILCRGLYKACEVCSSSSESLPSPPTMSSAVESLSGGSLPSPPREAGCFLVDSSALWPPLPPLLVEEDMDGNRSEEVDLPLPALPEELCWQLASDELPPPPSDIFSSSKDDSCDNSSSSQESKISSLVAACQMLQMDENDLVLDVSVSHSPSPPVPPVDEVIEVLEVPSDSSSLPAPPSSAEPLLQGASFTPFAGDGEVQAVEVKEVVSLDNVLPLVESVKVFEINSDHTLVCTESPSPPSLPSPPVSLLTVPICQEDLPPPPCLPCHCIESAWVEKNSRLAHSHDKTQSDTSSLGCCKEVLEKDTLEIDMLCAPEESSLWPAGECLPAVHLETYGEIDKIFLTKSLSPPAMNPPSLPTAVYDHEETPSEQSSSSKSLPPPSMPPPPLPTNITLYDDKTPSLPARMPCLKEHFTENVGAFCTEDPTLSQFQEPPPLFECSPNENEVLMTSTTQYAFDFWRNLLNKPKEACSHQSLTKSLLAQPVHKEHLQSTSPKSPNESFSDGKAPSGNDTSYELSCNVSKNLQALDQSISSLTSDVLRNLATLGKAETSIPTMFKKEVSSELSNLVHMAISNACVQAGLHPSPKSAFDQHSDSFSDAVSLTLLRIGDLKTSDVKTTTPLQSTSRDISSKPIESSAHCDPSLSFGAQASIDDVVERFVVQVFRSLKMGDLFGTDTELVISDVSLQVNHIMEWLMTTQRRPADDTDVQEQGSSLAEYILKSASEIIYERCGVKSQFSDGTVDSTTKGTVSPLNESISESISGDLISANLKSDQFHVNVGHTEGICELHPISNVVGDDGVFKPLPSISVADSGSDIVPSKEDCTTLHSEKVQEVAVKYVTSGKTPQKLQGVSTSSLDVCCEHRQDETPSEHVQTIHNSNHMSDKVGSSSKVQDALPLEPLYSVSCSLCPVSSVAKNVVDSRISLPRTLGKYIECSDDKARSPKAVVLSPGLVDSRTYTVDDSPDGNASNGKIVQASLDEDISSANKNSSSPLVFDTARPFSNSSSSSRSFAIAMDDEDVGTAAVRVSGSAQYSEVDAGCHRLPGKVLHKVEMKNEVFRQLMENTYPPSQMLGIADYTSSDHNIDFKRTTRSSHSDARKSLCSPELINECTSGLIMDKNHESEIASALEVGPFLQVACSLGDERGAGNPSDSGVSDNLCTSKSSETAFEILQGQQQVKIHQMTIVSPVSPTSSLSSSSPTKVASPLQGDESRDFASSHLALDESLLLPSIGSSKCSEVLETCTIFIQNETTTYYNHKSASASSSSISSSSVNNNAPGSSSQKGEGPNGGVVPSHDSRLSSSSSPSERELCWMEEGLFSKSDRSDSPSAFSIPNYCLQPVSETESSYTMVSSTSLVFREDFDVCSSHKSDDWDSDVENALLPDTSSKAVDKENAVDSGDDQSDGWDSDAGEFSIGGNKNDSSRASKGHGAHMYDDDSDDEQGHGDGDDGGNDRTPVAGDNVKKQPEDDNSVNFDSEESQVENLPEQKPGESTADNGDGLEFDEDDVFAGLSETYTKRANESEAKAMASDEWGDARKAMEELKESGDHGGAVDVQKPQKGFQLQMDDDSWDSEEGSRDNSGTDDASPNQELISPAGGVLRNGERCEATMDITAVSLPDVEKFDGSEWDSDGGDGDNKDVEGPLEEASETELATETSTPVATRQAVPKEEASDSEQINTTPLDVEISASKPAATLAEIAQSSTRDVLSDISEKEDAGYVPSKAQNSRSNNVIDSWDSDDGESPLPITPKKDESPRKSFMTAVSETETETESEWERDRKKELEKKRDLELIRKREEENKQVELRRKEEQRKMEEEQERQRREEEERRRVERANEEERLRKARDEERRQQAEREEAERLRLEEEARRKREEEQRKRKEKEEAERKAKEEERKRQEDERLRHWQTEQKKQTDRLKREAEEELMREQEELERQREREEEEERLEEERLERERRQKEQARLEQERQAATEKERLEQEVREREEAARKEREETERLRREVEERQAKEHELVEQIKREREEKERALKEREKLAQLEEQKWREGKEGVQGKKREELERINNISDKEDEKSREIRARRERAERELQEARTRMARRTANSLDDSITESDFGESLQEDFLTAPKNGITNGTMNPDDDGLSYTSTENDEPREIYSPTRDFQNRSLGLNDTTGLSNSTDQLRELRKQLDKERGLRTNLENRKKSWEKEKNDLNRKIDNLTQSRSLLEQSKLDLEAKIRNLEYNVNEEVEKRKNAEVLLQKTKQQLSRKEEQYTSEIESKQKADMNLRNAQMEVRSLQLALRQMEEEKEDIGRQLHQEKTTRQLQEQINEEQQRLHDTWAEERNKSTNQQAEVINKLEEADETRQVAQGNLDKMNAELYQTKMELEKVRNRLKDENGILSAENEDLLSQVDELRNDIKLNEEALAHATVQYNIQLSAAKNENAALVANVEKMRAAQEKLEADTDSLSKRLAAATAEVEKASQARNELERTVQKQREDSVRNLEKKDDEISRLKDSSQSLAQRLGAAEAKVNSLENEYHVANTALIERTTQYSNQQRELDQKKSVAETMDRDLRAEKEKNTKLQTKVEVMQDKLQGLQHESLTLKQKLENAHKDREYRDRDSFGARDQMSSLMASLKSSDDRNVISLQEKNNHLRETLSRANEDMRTAQAQRQSLEQELRHVTQQLGEAQKRLSSAEASLEVYNRTKEQFEREKASLQLEAEKGVQQLRGLQEKQGASEGRIRELTLQLERAQREAQEARERGQVVSQQATGYEKSMSELEEACHKLEIDKTKVEAALKSETQKVESLNRELDDAHRVQANLELIVKDLKGSQNRLEERLGAETVNRTFYAQEADENKEAYDLEIKARSKLGLRLAQLERARNEAGSELESERRKARRAMEMKRTAETKLEEAINSKNALSSEVAALKAHLKAAKKRLKEVGGNESRVNQLYSEFDRERMALDGSMSALRRQLDEVRGQLESELDKSERLQAENQSLKMEVGTLRNLEKTFNKMEKAKRRLEDDLSSYKAHVNNNYIERSELQRLQQGMEASARQELNSKLGDVNTYLEEQAKAKEKLDAVRLNNELAMKTELETTRKNLMDEVSNLRKSYSESLAKRETTDMEARKYKELYENETKLRERLVDKLSKANDKSAAASMELSFERQRNMLLGAGAAPSWLQPASTPLTKPFSHGLNNSLSQKLTKELDRSIAKHLESTPRVDISPIRKSKDDSYLMSNPLNRKYFV